MEQNLLEIVEVYEKVISNFKRKSGVLSGFDLAYKGSKASAAFEDTPKSIGDGLGTTGWCVSASKALLIDPLFSEILKIRGAFAKLISIDIKEQFWGVCYNGSQNKWHTAILVQEKGINLVIDITCRQFGNDFIEKDIWDFATWQERLRSPDCSHKLFDFDNNEMGISPVTNYQDKKVTDDPIYAAEIKGKLKNINNLNDYDREQLVYFFLQEMNKLNVEILTGKLNVSRYKYGIEIVDKLSTLPTGNCPEAYAVLKFKTKQSAENWLSLLLTEKKTPQYLVFSETFSDSCKYNDIIEDRLNLDRTKCSDYNETFVCIKINNCYGVDVSFLKNGDILLPVGCGLDIKFDEENIYNGGKLYQKNYGGVEKITNTIYINI